MGYPKPVHRVIAQQIEEDCVLLSEAESHHLVRVLRVRPGDICLAHDGKGSIFRCRLVRGPEGWQGDILEKVESQTESAFSICLAQSLIKKDKFEWVIQKAVELGIDQLVPVISWRTEVRLDEGGLSHKMQRWQKIVAEAFKQSGRKMLPTLQMPVPLEAFLQNWSAELRFVLDEAGGVPLRSLLEEKRTARSCYFLVGPEGGWDERDRQLFAAHGVTPVQLGKRVLRTETCPIAVLSILQYELGDLG
ncbi:MAG: 16S rRNA (uracil(1498)-N(3))-methyltransferase [Acidobacteria bacterium]|nr:MAG: 16S rRNA (uracil(1498)-N(3))-methyltransferase [Acidobacteriota bacterium]